MGQRIALATRDGAPFAAYRAPPQEARRGGIVMLHAIWGVTPHIRQLSDSLAEQGYEVIAPSLMDAADERKLKALFGVSTTPTLVFVRGRATLGAIERMKGWDHYAARVGELLDGATGTRGEATLQ